MIRKAIEHNENVFDSLSSMINDTAKQVQDNYPKFSADIVKQETMKYFNFIAPDGFVACLFSRPRQGYDKFYSNVVRTKAVSDDLLIGSLIKELNRLFEAIQNIEPVASAKKEEE